MNYALHMIALTQARGIGPGRAYLDKVQAGGKIRTEGQRLLRRWISDAAFAALRTDQGAGGDLRLMHSHITNSGASAAAA